MPTRKAAAPRRRHVPKTATVDTKVVNNLTKEQDQISLENISKPVSESLLNPAHVTVAGKITRNLGDFNSAQVSVSLTLPCLATDSDIDACYEKVTAWVGKKIEEELAKV
jgi:hypothetical protein